MVRRDLLDVLRVDLHPAGVDHVLLPVDEIEEAVLVDVAEIAAVEPAVAQRLRGLLGTVVIARHRDRGAADDLADFARGNVAPVVADDPHLGERRRHADAAGLAHGVVAVEDRDETLGQAVELVEPPRQELVQPVLVLLHERRAEREHHLERREARGIEALRIQDRDDLRGDEHRVRHALALDGVDERLGVERAVQHVGRPDHERGEHRHHRAVEHDRP